MLINDAIHLVCPGGARFAKALQEASFRYQIDTKRRAAHWLGQLAHESDGFKVVRENLNYSAEGLMKTWPVRFPTKAIADQYARDPIKIANHVYCNRIGNGDEASGDGARYIGRGLIQLTGKSNYAEASEAIYKDDRLVMTPTLVEEPEAAALTAGWFWLRKGLNSLADDDDLLGITKKINGGLNGLDDRKYWVERFRNVL